MYFLILKNIKLFFQHFTEMGNEVDNEGDKSI